MDSGYLAMEPATTLQTMPDIPMWKTLLIAGYFITHKILTNNKTYIVTNIEIF